MPERKPVKLQMYEMPFQQGVDIDKVMSLSFGGALVALVYDDDTYDFVENPWYECDQIIGEFPGIYKVRVYIDKDHKYGLYTTFKVRVEDFHIVEKLLKSEI